MGRHTERRTGEVRPSTYRRSPFERQLFAQRRPRRRRAYAVASGRGFLRNPRTPMRLCFFVAAVLLAIVVAFPLMDLRSAAADIEAPSRAANEVATLKDTSDLPRTISFDVPSLQQNPELPTGCESVALTNALLSFGFNLAKTEIADTWLPMSDSDFVTAFMGDPHSADGHSCMAPAITQTADSYLLANSSTLRAHDLTGASFSDVLAEVAAGHPAIVWCTIDLAEPGDAYNSARAFDRTYRLYPNSHCVVVRGYDLDSGVAFVSDPLAGDVTYNLDTLMTRYYQLGAQAVVIK